MKISICGSMQALSKMQSLASELQDSGYEVALPNPDEAKDVRDDAVAWAKVKSSFIREHFAKIDSSDAVLIVNEDKNGIANYIGGNTLIEISHAYAQGLDIFLLNPVPEVSYADEILGMHPIILNGDIRAIDTYIRGLPLVYMSTESALKQGAISRAMRRAGIPVRVDGKKVDSGVDEQPMTIEETYTGAFNRHKNLKDLGMDADYYVTVESGLHSVHDEYGHYGCQAIVFEPKDKKMRLGVDFDLEFPKDMLAKVPSKYADIGVLVQEEYGATSKDPYPYLTNGKVTRQAILENALYNLVVQEGVRI